MVNYTPKTTTRKCTKCSGTGAYMGSRTCYGCRGAGRVTRTTVIPSQNMIPTHAIIQANLAADRKARRAARRAGKNS